LASPPISSFPRQYIGYIAGIVVILLAVLGLIGVVPFTAQVVFGMLLVLALACFV
jgi:hypothetical protein